MNKTEIMNDFVLDKFFDTKIREEKIQNWKKLYIVVSPSIDLCRGSADYLCHIVTFEPKKALNAFKKAQVFHRHPDFMTCTFVNVYYVPPTFNFKATDRYDRISEWFNTYYPNYQDIIIPYENQAHAKCIASCSINKIKNTTDYDDLMANMVDMICDDAQHWWSDVKEIYSPDDFYRNFDTEKFDIVKSDNCVCKKVYSIVALSPDDDIQLLALTYSFQDALSKSFHVQKKNMFMVLCHYVPFDFKHIEKWTNEDITFLENKMPDEVYTLDTIEWMGLLA